MFGRGPKEILITIATEADLPEIADLHGEVFSRGWSTAELMGMFQQKGALFLIAREVGKRGKTICGFNIVRQTETEAEIISVAVSPAMQGNDIGVRLMRDAITRLIGDRVLALFLEVDENNTPAVSLYKRLGFRTVGQRPSYYRENGDESAEQMKRPASTALVMRLDLG